MERACAAGERRPRLVEASLVEAACAQDTSALSNLDSEDGRITPGSARLHLPGLADALQSKARPDASQLSSASRPLLRQVLS